MNPFERILRTLASLRIAVALLGLIVMLIFFGSLAQTRMGIWHVLEMYFKYPVVWVDFNIFAPAQYDLKGAFPFFGGVTLGIALLVNLSCAFALKFQPTKKLPWLLAGTLVTTLGATLVAYAHLDPHWRQRLTENPFTMLGGGLLLYTPMVVGFFLLYGKRAGMVMIHLAVILLVVGQGITSYRAVETHMGLHVGDVRNYAEDLREYELAVSTPKKDGSGLADVECVPQWMLESPGKAGKILPQGVVVDQWLPNATLVISKAQQPSDLLTWTPSPDAPMLVGKRLELAGIPPVSGVGEAMNNTPGMIVTAHGHAIALYGDAVFARQVPGTDIRLQLRPKRQFLPYAVRLEKATHDVYPGTSIAKNYASSVTILEEGKAPRHEEISMNKPLRIGQETLYQEHMGNDTNGATSGLQVVRNPAWTVPYIACATGAVGLLLHFLLSLAKFLKRGAAQTPKVKSDAHEPRAQARGDAQTTAGDPPELALGARERKSRLGWLLPSLAAFICALALGYALLPKPAIKSPSFNSPPNIQAFADLPVVAGGRVQPVDSVARNTLLAISGKSELYLPAQGDRPARTLSATEWLLNVISGTKEANDYPIFRIDHEGAKALIGQRDSTEKRFSIAQIAAHMSDKEFNEAMAAAEKVPHENRDAREKALVELGNRISQYARLRGHAAWSVLTAPTPTGRHDAMNWLPLREGMATMQEQGWVTNAQIAQWAKALAAWQKLPDGMAQLQKQAGAWQDLQEAWGKQDAPAFDSAVTALRQAQMEHAPGAVDLAATEAAFNRADPFYLALWIYVCAALCVFGSWMFWHKPLWRTAFILVGIAFVIHTAALIVRIWISGRPPVTNLYSSAIFVGWGLAGFSLVAEYVLSRVLQVRLGFTLLVGAIAGSATLVIANVLAEGDTIGVLQAVLDTNFWLATHVVIITLGYAATFLAGLLGIIYLGAQFFVNDRASLRALTTVIYGALCFALLLSFVGTILGGIWADQSWGRFWGWDPKENGAMMIVLWNALILHARMGGLVRERGLAALAVLGNIVTAWSWFGVNQLSTGLHSYGFTDSAAFWLIVFVLANLAVAALVLLPKRKTA